MKRILVIDDSPTIRKAIVRILKPMGYECVEAGDGAEAMALLKADHAYSAILCDIDMPVMDGLAFLGELSAQAAFPAPPVIMCTTNTAFDKIQAALGLGASEYIMKPCDAEIIGSKLAACGVE